MSVPTWVIYVLSQNHTCHGQKMAYVVWSSIRYPDSLWWLLISKYTYTYMYVYINISVMIMGYNEWYCRVVNIYICASYNGIVRISIKKLTIPRISVGCNTVWISHNLVAFHIHGCNTIEIQIYFPSNRSLELPLHAKIKFFLNISQYQKSQVYPRKCQMFFNKNIPKISDATYVYIYIHILYIYIYTYYINTLYTYYI